MKESLLAQHRSVVLWQIGVLLVILTGIFGAFLVSSDKSGPGILSQTKPAEDKSLSVIPDSLALVSVRAKAAYVWDVRNQKFLYSKNSDEALPLASITKLMTSFLAYELMSEKTSTTITANTLQQDGSAGLQAGESLSAEALTNLSLVSSSNDAAHALATQAGRKLGERDPVEQFILAMNERAKELDLPSLQFENATGLDVGAGRAGAQGSAKDVSLLLEQIITMYPDLLINTTKPAARVYNESGGYHDAENTNEVLYAIPNLLASKTGYTDLAGGNLTIAYDAGLNRPIIVTVLGSTREERFTDVLRLVGAVNDSISKI